MNWNNLLKNKCPKCNKGLWFDKDEAMVMCHSLRCGFMIDQAKMESICIGKTTTSLKNASNLSVEN